LPDPSMKRLIEMNASEWYFIVIGCVMALAQGTVQPSFALIFGSMLGVSFFVVVFDCCICAISYTN